MSNTDYTYPQEQTSNKQLIAMLLVMLAVFAVFCFTLWQYDQSHKKAPTSAVTLQKQVDGLHIQNKALTTQNGTLTATNVELGNEKTQLCADLTKAKVLEPLCAKQ